MVQQTKLQYDPSVQPDNSATAHVADPTAYGQADPTQQRYVGNATVIPRAAGHASSGRHRFTNELVIDPSDPATGEGGVRVNLDGLDKYKMAAALQTAGSAKEAWQNAEKQRTSGPKPMQAPPAPIPAAPQRPAAETASLLAELGALQGMPVAQMPMAPPAPAPVPQPPQITVAPPYAAPSTYSGGAAPAAPPQESPLAAQIATLARIVTQLVQQPPQAAPAPVTQPQAVQGPPGGPPPGASVASAMDDSGQAVLEDLGLDFLGVKAKKPTVPVYMDLGPGGHMSFKAHWVSVYNGLVILLTDGRYDGLQFMPPNVEHTLKIRLPENNNKTYKVYSRDVVFPIGKLELCVLVIEDDANTSVDAESSEAMLAPAPMRGAPPVPVPQRRPAPGEFPPIGQNDQQPDDEQLPDIL